MNGCSLEKHLEQVGILDFFPLRMYSYEFDFRKPDARIFKVAAERIGETAENILFVGDRIDTDITPVDPPEVAGGGEDIEDSDGISEGFEDIDP